MHIKYNSEICPYCGNMCKWPIIGNITNKDLDIDNEYCLLYNIVNEKCETIGYDIWCKNNVDGTIL